MPENWLKPIAPALRALSRMVAWQTTFEEKWTGAIHNQHLNGMKPLPGQYASTHAAPISSGASKACCLARV
jgi:hypothetical protein